MHEYVSAELKSDELVYAINVWDVQELARQRIGRELNFDEMNSVKKGVEWGFFDWFDVVNIAIDSAIEEKEK